MQQRMIATHHFLVAKVFYSQPKWSIDRTVHVALYTAMEYGVCWHNAVSVADL